MASIIDSFVFKHGIEGCAQDDKSGVIMGVRNGIPSKCFNVSQGVQ